MADSDDQPPPLWRVITFYGETFGANPLHYLTVGVLGGFLGRFEEVPFSEVTRDYGVLDDRDLWLVRLELDDLERDRLAQAISSRWRQWYPYNFFQKNCAYYLMELLAEATDLMPTPSRTVSPVEVVEEALQSGLGRESYFRPAISARIAAMGKQSGGDLPRQLKARSWIEVAGDTAYHTALEDADRQLLLQYLALKTDLSEEALPASAQSGMASLRVLTANGEPEPTRHVQAQGPGSVTQPRFHPYTRLRSGAGWSEGEATRAIVEVRGAMHDESDPWYGHRPLNTMELLSVGVSTPTSDLEPRLEKLVFFSQRALGSSDWVRSRSSWMLELQMRRGGLYSAEGLHSELRYGQGWTLDLPWSFYTYGLLTLGGVGQWHEGLTVAAGTELGLVMASTGRFRSGLRWSHERDAFDWNISTERLLAWGKLDLSLRLGLIGVLEKTAAGRRWRLGFDWYR
jgi:hypothetical protein